MHPSEHCKTVEQPLPLSGQVSWTMGPEQLQHAKWAMSKAWSGDVWAQVGLIDRPLKLQTSAGGILKMAPGVSGTPISITHNIPPTKSNPNYRISNFPVLPMLNNFLNFQLSS